MPSPVSLATMRAAAIQLSDQTNSGFITTAEWTTYINAEAALIYRKIVQADPDRYIRRNPDYLFPLNCGWILYSGQTGTGWVVGETVTGGTSGAHGVVVAMPDQTLGAGLTGGALYLGNISGTFKNGEALTAPSGTAATSASLFNSANQYVPLPNDFWMVNRVDYIQSSAQPYVFQTILAVNQMEEDAYQFTTVSFYGQGIRYRLQGNQICFVPTPPISGQIRLLYTPAYKNLVADADTIDDLSGYADNIAIGAAVRALVKEQSLGAASALKQLKAELDQEFDRMAQATRDKSTPATTVSLRGKNSGRGGPYRNW